MKRYSYIVSIITFFSVSATSNVYAQNAVLTKQLEQSEHLKYTMKPDTADAGLTRWLQKKTTQSRALLLSEDFNALKITGPGTISINKSISHSGKASILLETPASLGVKKSNQSQLRHG